MMTFFRGKALLHALVILPPQKEYPLQLDKKSDGFRAFVDAVEKKKCLPIAGINPQFFENPNLSLQINQLL
jgi:hypothetical protein